MSEGPDSIPNAPLTRSMLKDWDRSRTLAVVSGKGGSGKTMFVACLARALDDRGIDVTLVDTDIGTGGLSYYLSVNYAHGIASGLSELVLAKSFEAADKAFDISSSISRPTLSYASYSSVLRPLSDFANTVFVSVGDHRKLLRLHGEDAFRRYIGACVEGIKEHSKGRLILLDCRGGVDEESLAVCEVADQIVVLVETDPASFQTTQYLVDVLSDRELSDKLGGFVINRVFDDPSIIVNQGVHSFRAQFLSAIPFDLTALRGFNTGQVPDRSTVFYQHSLAAITKLYPMLFSDYPRVWNFSDFKYSNVDDPSSRIGGRAVAFLSIICLIAFSVVRLFFPLSIEQIAIRNSQEINIVYYILPFVLGMAGGITAFRRAIGNVVLWFGRDMQRFFIAVERIISVVLRSFAR